MREKKVSDQPSDGILGDLDERLLRQPSVALSHLYQEMGKMITYAVSTLTEAFEAFIKKDVTVKQDVQDRNAKLSAANRAAVEYLVKLSASSLVMEDEKTNKNQLDYVNILHNLCVEEEILTALENRNTEIKEKEQLIEQKDQVIKARKLLLVSMLRKQGRSNEEIAILLHLTEEEVDKLLGTEE